MSSVYKDHFVPPGVEWDGVPEETPPKLLPYLPSNTRGEQGLHSDYNVSWVNIRKILVLSSEYGRWIGGQSLHVLFYGQMFYGK